MQHFCFLFVFTGNAYIFKTATRCWKILFCIMVSRKCLERCVPTYCNELKNLTTFPNLHALRVLSFHSQKACGRVSATPKICVSATMMSQSTLFPDSYKAFSFLPQ